MFVVISACVKQMPNDETGVAVAVETLRTAMVSAKAADLNAITDDNLMYVHSDGLVETKAEFVENIAGGHSVFVTLDFSDIQISVSGNTAVVRHLFEAKTNHGGVSGSVKIGIMLTWHKQGSEWKLLGRQAQKLIVP
jgi:ketosteroid isomerase-like protein